MGENYGWAIVLVTVAINLLLFPLRLTSMKSSKKMQAHAAADRRHQRQVQELSLRDPKKAEQNQEMMDLYKKNGVNPVGGCLPMLIQLPFLYAFYKVLACPSKCAARVGCGCTIFRSRRRSPSTCCR